MVTPHDRTGEGRPYDRGARTVNVMELQRRSRRGDRHLGGKSLRARLRPYEGLVDMPLHPDNADSRDQSARHSTGHCRPRRVRRPSGVGGLRTHPGQSRPTQLRSTTRWGLASGSSTRAWWFPLPKCPATVGGTVSLSSKLRIGSACGLITLAAGGAVATAPSARAVRNHLVHPRDARLANRSSCGRPDVVKARAIRKHRSEWPLPSVVEAVRRLTPLDAVDRTAYSGTPCYGRRARAGGRIRAACGGRFSLACCAISRYEARRHLRTSLPKHGCR